MCSSVLSGFSGRKEEATFGLILPRHRVLSNFGDDLH